MKLKAICLIIIFSITLITACSRKYPDWFWYKENATDEDLHRDNKQCMYEIKPLNTRHYDTDGPMKLTRCMKSYGWKQMMKVKDKEVKEEPNKKAPAE